MKTKEMDVWLKSYFEEGKEDYSGMIIEFDDSDDGYNHITKAKIIIEIPEKKIEITESEFKE